MGLFGSGRQAQLSGVRALLFDVFGTTVDWKGSMLAHARRLGSQRGISADWAGLVTAWYTGAKPLMKEYRSSLRRYVGFDVLLRRLLDDLAPGYGAEALTPADRDLLTHGWSYLDSWPEASDALGKLRERFIIGALSNGTTRQMIALSRWANLPWNVIFAAEMVRSYKPAPKLYRQAAGWLGLAPGEVMLVAAHTHDLNAARKVGFKTCFVHRPAGDALERNRYDLVTDDFEQLARLLGAA